MARTVGHASSDTIFADDCLRDSDNHNNKRKDRERQKELLSKDEFKVH